MRLNRICSKNDFFNVRCNSLEKWLTERGYSEKLVRKELLKGRALTKEALLDKENVLKMMIELLLTLNIIQFSKLLGTF